MAKRLPPSSATTGASSQRGAVLLVVLVFLFISTMGATALYEMHQTQMQREKEEQLIFVGNQFRRAIASYFNTLPPGSARSLPQTLEDLVDDHRFPTPIHHLRRIYADPLTGGTDWTLIRNASGIVGIASSSKKLPIRANGPDGQASTGNSGSYDAWAFVIKLP